MPTASTVLVVDDDEGSRQLLQTLLEQEKYTVVLAKNGFEALEQAGRIQPDVVLLDILMPDLDGFEVCRRLRLNPALRQVPIVLLTALEGRDSRLRGLAAGADEFLNKPVDLIELSTRIRTITGLNRFRQLCDERARFETAVAFSPIAIVLTDGDGKVVHANAAFTALVGRVPARIFACFLPDTAEALIQKLAERRGPGIQVEPREVPLAISTTPGATAEISVVRLPWSEGVLYEFILRDVTDRKQLEMQLMRLQRIELLGQLASGVVHDVNNLLLAIVANADLLGDDASAQTRDNAKIIRQSADRGAALLRRILMFARGADQSLEPVSVPAALSETAEIAGKLLGAHIALDIDVPPDLPQILGDANQFHQVVMNLCVNARDAMPVGGRLLVSATAVSLDAAAARKIDRDAVEGDYVAISVRDTGIGIAPEHRDRLFDPFFTTKPRETATGLGLATVLRVMRRHQGFIGLETEVGDGTCFTCYFPAISGR